MITEQATISGDRGQLVVRLPLVWFDRPQHLTLRLRSTGDDGSARSIQLRAHEERPDVWVSSPSALSTLEGELQAELGVPLVGRVPLPPLVVPPAPRTRGPLTRGLRAVAGLLPTPITSRLKQTRVVQRLRDRG